MLQLLQCCTRASIAGEFSALNRGLPRRQSLGGRGRSCFLKRPADDPRPTDCRQPESDVQLPLTAATPHPRAHGSERILRLNRRQPLQGLTTEIGAAMRRLYIGQRHGPMAMEPAPVSYAYSRFLPAWVALREGLPGHCRRAMMRRGALSARRRSGFKQRYRRIRPSQWPHEQISRGHAIRFSHSTAAANCNHSRLRMSQRSASMTFAPSHLACAPPAVKQRAPSRPVEATTRRRPRHEKMCD